MGYDLEPMLELFIYETNQQIDTLEKACIDVEDIGAYTEDAISEIFRGMHTIKGSSGMMMYDQISSLSHALEDLFDLLRSEESIEYDTQVVTDLTLDTLDFISSEMGEIEAGNGANEDSSKKIRIIKDYIAQLKGEPKKKGRTKKVEPPSVTNYYIASEPEAEIGQKFDIRIFYSDDCVMENVRSFTLMNNIREMCIDLVETPTNLLEADEATVAKIKEHGFLMRVMTVEDSDSFTAYLTGYPYVKSFTVEPTVEEEVKVEIKEFNDDLLVDEAVADNFDIGDDDLSGLLDVLDAVDPSTKEVSRELIIAKEEMAKEKVKEEKVIEDKIIEERNNEASKVLEIEKTSTSKKNKDQASKDKVLQ